MNSPLQLDRYVVDVLSVTANKVPAGERGESVTADVGLLPRVFSNKEDPNHYQVQLEVIFKSIPEAEPLTYEVHVKGRAFFHIEGDTTPEAADTLVRFNGTSILLGLFRGIVAQVTGQGPHGTFLLPPLNLVEAYEKLAELESEESDCESVEVEAE